MADKSGQLRVTLEEIERLIGEADRSGTSLDGWIEQLAVELRAAMPEESRDGSSEMAERILSDPRRSLRAQAHIDAATVRILREKFSDPS